MVDHAVVSLSRGLCQMWHLKRPVCVQCELAEIGCGTNVGEALVEWSQVLDMSPPPRIPNCSRACLSVTRGTLARSSRAAGMRSLANPARSLAVKFPMAVTGRFWV